MVQVAAPLDQIPEWGTSDEILPVLPLRWRKTPVLPWKQNAEVALLVTDPAPPAWQNVLAAGHPGCGNLPHTWSSVGTVLFRSGGAERKPLNVCTTLGATVLFPNNILCLPYGPGGMQSPKTARQYSGIPTLPSKPAFLQQNLKAAGIHLCPPALSLVREDWAFGLGERAISRFLSQLTPGP